MTNLCQNVCNEFEALGFNKDIDPTSLKENYNVIKNSEGQWFKSTKPSFHEAAKTIALDLNAMPAFKELTNILDELDKEIKKEGGRIFISEYLVYKIKKGTQTPLLVYKNTERIEGKYRKICDEIIEQGLERDRYRTEETYMLSKNSGTEWSMTTSHENHRAIKTILDLKKMPELKIVVSKIAKIDSKFQTNGGRIFITPTRIYRLSNKIEVIFKV